jgi:Second Messenger Oligonucleotide or Dinucleotide Synthetase domain
MTSIDDAFTSLKTNLEITTTERDLAVNRHHRIRDHIRQHWSLTEDFLTGSYDRHTKTKKLKDVDIFVVIDPNGPQADLTNDTGAAAVTALAQVIKEKWSDVTTDDTVVTISYSGEEVASYEIAPAFATSHGYKIPNGSGWMNTNPNEHARLVTEKNKKCDGKFVPLVKMIKGMNRNTGEPIQPSFLIEVMALDLVESPLGAYKDEVRFLLASMVDQIVDDWPDPAGLGPNVNGGSSTWQRIQQQTNVRGWLGVAEEAILLEAEGKERAAVDKWRELFGDRMPRP